MNRQHFLILVSIILISSCSSDITEEYPELVGMWTHNSKTIDIYENGSGIYTYYSSTGFSTTTKTVTGNVKVKNDELTIGSGTTKVTFAIDQYPTNIQVDATNSNTFIILDNEKYYKYPYLDIDYGYFCSNGELDDGEEDIDCGGYCAACPNCIDEIQNQGETGIDCGGPCPDCQYGSCYDSMLVNTAYLAHCSGNYVPNQYDFSFSFYFNIGFNNYEISDQNNGWQINIVFPKKPEVSLVYNLTSHFYDVDYYSSAYNTASIMYQSIAPSENPYCFLVGDGFLDEGKLYVIVEDSTVTATFCNLEFYSSLYGCLYGSGRLEWNLDLMEP